MNAVCLLVAGVLRATLPTDAFTLAWEHSVEKTRWEEDYRVVDDSLVLSESRVEGFGAGMEPAPGAELVGGTWRWHPALTLPQLRITSAAFTADYALCWDGRCLPLRTLVRSAGIEVVTIAPCAR